MNICVTPCEARKVYTEDTSVWYLLDEEDIYRTK